MAINHFNGRNPPPPSTERSWGLENLPKDEDSIKHRQGWGMTMILQTHPRARSSHADLTPGPGLSPSPQGAHRRHQPGAVAHQHPGVPARAGVRGRAGRRGWGKEAVPVEAERVYGRGRRGGRGCAGSEGMRLLCRTIYASIFGRRYMLWGRISVGRSAVHRRSAAQGFATRDDDGSSSLPPRGSVPSTQPISGPSRPPNPSLPQARAKPTRRVRTGGSIYPQQMTMLA